MILTKMIRYDDKDNIVFEKKAHESGASINTKKDLEYDDKGNIIEIHEVVTMVDPSKPQPTIMSDSTTNLEYTEYYGKPALTRVFKDGLEQQKSEYRGKYTAANGDSEDDSSASIYVYSDYIDPETNQKSLVRTIIFDTYQLTNETLSKLKKESYISKDIEIPDKFDTVTIQTEYVENNKISSAALEIVKINMGSTDIAAYCRRIDWVDGEDYGIMKEAFWTETGDSSDDVRYFNEYNREYKVDRNYNIIESLVDKELLSEICLKDDIYCSRKVINKQTELPFYFYEIKEERECGIVNVSISEDSNHDVIARTEKLNGQIINQSYVKFFDDKKVSYTTKATEYETVGSQCLVSMVLSAEENGAFVKEEYTYDSLGRMVLRTIHRKDVIEEKEEEYEGHVIYKYDTQGKCVAEITENSMSTYLYDAHGRKVFIIDNVNYPLAKEIFDLHFNELLNVLE